MGKSVVCGKIICPSGVLMSPPATYLTTTFTHVHTHAKPTYYAVDNATIDLSNNATRWRTETRN